MTQRPSLQTAIGPSGLRGAEPRTAPWSVEEFLRDIEPVGQTGTDRDAELGEAKRPSEGPKDPNPFPVRAEPEQCKECTPEQGVNLFLWIAKFLGTNRVTRYFTQENIDKIERMSALAIGINAMYVFDNSLVLNIVNKLVDYCDVFEFTPPVEKFTKSTEGMKWLVSEIHSRIGAEGLRGSQRLSDSHTVTKQTETEDCVSCDVHSRMSHTVITWAQELIPSNKVEKFVTEYLKTIIDFHTKFPTVQFEQFFVTKEEFTQQILNFDHNLKLLNQLPISVGINSNYLKIRSNPLLKIIRIPEDVITDDPELSSVLFDDVVHEHNEAQEHNKLLKKLRWDQPQITTVSSRWEAVNNVLKHVQDCLGVTLQAAPVRGGAPLRPEGPIADCRAKNYDQMFNQAFLRNDFVNIMYLHMAQQEVQRCHTEYLADINKITVAKQKSVLLQKYLCRDLAGMLVEYLL